MLVALALQDFDKLSVEKDDELWNNLLNELIVDLFAGLYEPLRTPDKEAERHKEGDWQTVSGGCPSHC